MATTYTDTTLPQLVINRMTKEIYDSLPVKSENELYIITDDDSYEIQVSTVPVASESILNRIIQYIGTTTSTYTNGYFYKCTAQGTDPETYAWEHINVQPGSSYTAGTGIDITNNVISNTGVINTATGTQSITILGTPTTGSYNINIGANAHSDSAYGVAIGYGSGVGNRGCAIGDRTSASGLYSVAIGSSANASAYGAIQLGGGQNSETGTVRCYLKTAQSSLNCKLLDSDGTIPEARLADTTNASAGQVLTLDSNGNAVWTDPMQFRTGSLVAADWVDNTATTGTYDQTITVQGITLNNNIMISPAPNSAVEYHASSILCSGQNTNSLSFSATTQPSNNLTINVLIFG